MNWAWRQALTPTLKLVLMALADAADDQGVCWPSVSTLAKKCTVSTRAVQRSLRVLIRGRNRFRGSWWSDLTLLVH